jgi:hypothetical protein
MRNLRHFERLHFIDSALVPLRSTEASLQERLNQFPCQCRPDHLTAERKYIHIVVFHALMSGEHIVDEPGAHTSNLVGADGCTHATAAERYPAINFAGGNGSGQWNHVIRVIISGARLNRTEVYDLMGSPAQQFRDPLF